MPEIKLAFRMSWFEVKPETDSFPEIQFEHRQKNCRIGVEPSWLDGRISRLYAVFDVPVADPQHVTEKEMPILKDAYDFFVTALDRVTYVLRNKYQIISLSTLVRNPGIQGDCVDVFSSLVVASIMNTDARWEEIDTTKWELPKASPVVDLSETIAETHDVISEQHWKALPSLLEAEGKRIVPRYEVFLADCKELIRNRFFREALVSAVSVVEWLLLERLHQHLSKQSDIDEELLRKVNRKLGLTLMVDFSLKLVPSLKGIDPRDVQSLKDGIEKRNNVVHNLGINVSLREVTEVIQVVQKICHVLWESGN